ncbi:MAG: hypothetical protein QOD99_1388 [Chthoniobacter sp.]|jgi:SAM-dependent MidA family methyltransferase|nr:hypothetical protein [Chthoniobacter sp.]
MSFRDFMAAALYDPEHGYYAAGHARIGREGDFFTNVSLGPLFGQMLATQFEEMWRRLGCPRDFRIVEQGAHSGDFAHDVLSGTGADFRRALGYVIIEPAPRSCEVQREKLRDFAEQISWRDSMAELEPFCGVHFSNELLDAFPVHCVRFVNGQWLERCVDADLRWIDCVINDDALRSRIAELPLPAIENYVTEINLHALSWIDAVAEKLQSGWVLAIDYGHPRDIYYAPQRASGTLAAYSQHRRIDDPLQNPGQIDLTAQVEWTSLVERGIADGLTLAGFTDQHHLFAALAQDFFAQTPPMPKQTRALQTLMHPQFLGTVFKVLALEKSISALSKPLRGFQFARDANAALGLPGA